MLIQLCSLMSVFTLMLYLTSGLAVFPVNSLFLALARFLLLFQCLCLPAILTGMYPAPYVAFVIPALCLLGEYLNWLKPFERHRIKREIANHLPQASKPQAKAVLKRMLREDLRVGSFTWHDGCIFFGRGNHSQIFHQSGRWRGVPPEPGELLNNYGPEQEILKQNFPVLFMQLNDGDAKSICALMYFGWKIASFEDAKGDIPDGSLKINLSRKEKTTTRLYLKKPQTA